MRASAVVSEAWRNIASGAARAGLWACLIAVFGIGLAVLDQRSVVGLIQSAQTYQDAGAATYVLTAPGAVNPRRCDNLSALPGVTASGALRQAGQITALAAPASPLTHMEATPGMATMLGVDQASTAGLTDGPNHTAGPDPASGSTPAGGQPSPGGGVWLSSAAAELLGAAPGNALPTSLGQARVDAVYTYPDQANDRALARAVVSPTPPSGRWDQCWVKLWPVRQDTLTLVYAVYDGSPDGTPTINQLVTQMGASFDAHHGLATRPTRTLPYVSLVAGLVIGWTAIALRRLELASALHARVPKSALVWQTLCETAVWTLPVALAALPATYIAATLGNPVGSSQVWATGLRVVAVTSLATLLGGMASTLATRENRLFTYFKNR